MVMNTIDTTQVGPESPRYGVVLADPPWRYANSSKSYGRRIERHYQTMSTGDICALQIPSADDAVLYLWSTSPHLPDALRVMESWGFRYRSSLVWDKLKMGCGYWARIRHELLLVGTKGKFHPPPPALRVPSVLAIPRTIHSRKPAVVRDLIASWYPGERKIELFARERAKGWDCWGNEVGCDVDVPCRAARHPSADGPPTGRAA
jgi:N6-adenosine-specific RNA methylase IME4